MTPRKTIHLLLAVAALGVLLLAIQLGVDLSFRDGQETRESRSAEAGRLFPAGGVEEIRSVTMETQDRVLTIDRVSDGDYAIELEDNELAARRDRVLAFLESLLALERHSRVTSDPTRHEELGVSEGTGFARGYDYSVGMTDASGNEREVRIGLLDDSSRVMVRRANEDTVYRVDDTISFYIEQGPIFWAELRVFAGRVSLSEVEHIRIQRLSQGEVVRERRMYREGRTRFELVDSDGSPEGNQNYGENEEAVRRMLSLEAGGFLRNDVDPVSWRIVLRPEDRGEIVVNIGARRGDAYPAEVVNGHETLVPARRPTLALRADLFEVVLELLLPEAEEEDPESEAEAR